MFDTTIAGSLPKPAWLAETHKLWPRWRLGGDALQEAKLDATALWIKAQEDLGLTVIGDGGVEHGGSWLRGAQHTGVARGRSRRTITPLCMLATSSWPA